MLLDIVVLPPPPVASRLGKLARQLNQSYPSWYVVDNKQLLLHISLLHLSLGKWRLPELSRVVGTIARDVKKFRLRATTLTASRESAELTLSLPKQLRKLNRKVVEQCVSLRTELCRGHFIESRQPNSAGYLRSTVRSELLFISNLILRCWRTIGLGRVIEP